MNVEVFELDDEEQETELELDAEGADDQADGDDNQDDEVEGGEDDETAALFTFGDEEATQDEGPDWAKDLRKKYREQERQLADYQARDRQQQIAQVGEKPRLEQFYERDNPEEAYEAELDQWKDRKAAAEQARDQQESAGRQFQQDIQSDFALVETQSRKLAVPDFQAALAEVSVALDEGQKASLVLATENKAGMLYALSKNPARLAELAKIKNPIKFAVAAAKLEMTMKTAPRRKAPPPEGIERGSARLSTQSADKREAQLEKDADRTGDRSALIKYRKDRQQKRA